MLTLQGYNAGCNACPGCGLGSQACGQQGPYLAYPSQGFNVPVLCIPVDNPWTLVNHLVGAPPGLQYFEGEGKGTGRSNATAQPMPRTWGEWILPTTPRTYESGLPGRGIGKGSKGKGRGFQPQQEVDFGIPAPGASLESSAAPAAPSASSESRAAPAASSASSESNQPARLVNQPVSTSTRNTFRAVNRPLRKPISLAELIEEAEPVAQPQVTETRGKKGKAPKVPPPHHQPVDIPSPRSIAGQVWRVARSKLGSQAIQDALAHAPDDETRRTLASELKGHVWDALCDPRSNEVLQKCICCMSAFDTHFIAIELAAGGITKAAKHRYGNRVLEKLLEHHPWREDLWEELFNDAVALCTDQYAVHVMIVMFKFAPEGERQRLVQLIVEHAETLASNAYAIALVSQVLGSNERLGKNWPNNPALAMKLWDKPSLIAKMGIWHHGLPLARSLMKHATEDCKSVIYSEVMQQRRELWTSKHGRRLASFVAQNSDLNVALTIHTTVADGIANIVLTSLAGNEVAVFPLASDSVYGDLKDQLFSRHPYLQDVTKFLLPTGVELSRLKASYPVAQFDQLDERSIRFHEERQNVNRERFHSSP